MRGSAFIMLTTTTPMLICNNKTVVKSTKQRKISSCWELAERLSYGNLTGREFLINPSSHVEKAVTDLPKTLGLARGGAKSSMVCSLSMAVTGCHCWECRKSLNCVPAVRTWGRTTPSGYKLTFRNVAMGDYTKQTVKKHQREKCWRFWWC